MGVNEYRDELGILPEALFNYLLRLGWSHGDDEIIPEDKAIEWFDLDGLNNQCGRHNELRYTVTRTDRKCFVRVCVDQDNTEFATVPGIDHAGIAGGAGWQAALGGQIEVPTIDGGKTRVKIPEGTESGKQFRLKAKGMPVLRSKQQGDLYIQVEVETPKSLTRKQRELLKEFENASNESTSPASTGFFARVKEFFEGQ